MQDLASELKRGYTTLLYTRNITYRGTSARVLLVARSFDPASTDKVPEISCNVGMWHESITFGESAVICGELITTMPDDRLETFASFFVTCTSLIANYTMRIYL
jgi:hypothetical protein